MAKRKLNVDRTEIVAVVVGKKPKVHNISYESLRAIRFKKCTEKKLFKPIDSEKIVIESSKTQQPIVYTKLKEQPYFDEYKEQLVKFAKNNNITFSDDT